MSSSIANSKPAGWLLLVALALPAGWMLRSLERPGWTPSTMRAEQWHSLAGRGGIPAVLGGLRSAVAGGFWLRANLAWERRDYADLRVMIESTVAADERPVYFWLNGARMLAYDVPTWVAPDAPGIVRRNMVRHQSDEALQFLEKGLRWHGADAALHIEMANICLRQRGDLEGAARHYRLAAEEPGAPYYAARIHADLLDQLGRRGEALAWLQRVLPGLPADDPAARREVVQARIKAWEADLAGRR